MKHQKWLKLSGIIIIGNIAAVSGILSFIGVKAFENPFYLALWMILAGLCIATAVLFKKARYIHILFAILILVLAAERGFNSFEFIKVNMGETTKSKILDCNIQLDSFKKPSPMDKNYRSNFTIIAPNGEEYSKTASVNHPAYFAGIGIYQYAYNTGYTVENVYLIRTNRFVYPLFAIGILLSFAFFVYYIFKRRRGEDVTG